MRIIPYLCGRKGEAKLPRLEVAHDTDEVQFKMSEKELNQKEHVQRVYYGAKVTIERAKKHSKRSITKANQLTDSNKKGGHNEI